MSHYYSQTPDTAHEIKHWSFDLKGHTFLFETDSNVFSKKTVDYGSRVLIETFTAEGLPEGNLLDMGCGYGPIGLSLAFSNPDRQVEMVDINERAVHLATENAKLNHLTNVAIHTSNLFENLADKNYAGILSNPPIRAGKKVVHEILTESYKHLLPNGALTIVIQKKQGAPSAKEKMTELFGNATILKKDKGYYIIQSHKK